MNDFHRPKPGGIGFRLPVVANEIPIFFATGLFDLKREASRGLNSVETAVIPIQPSRTLPFQNSVSRAAMGVERDRDLVVFAPPNLWAR